MKQTVEEAARTHWSESTYNKDAELAYDERDSIAIKALAKSVALRAFKKGADWQSRQSPWISVEEQLPEENENIIIMCKHGAIFNGTYCNGVWFCMDGYINDIYKDSPIYTSMSSIPPLWKPVAWMPILSFDEILEANKDVLERIKEKGD